MRSSEELKALEKKATIRLLRMHFESRIGHIGGNLSSLPAMLYVHLEVLGKEDVFVLSKGHAAGALYVSLWMAGKLAESELSEFHKDRTRLAGHPMTGWNPDIRFSTGSLGHGLSLSAGVALAKKLKGDPGTVYCQMSDGEWQEGSTWEALIFAAHHRLANLTLLVDLNGLQGFGSTREIASLDGLPGKLKAFDIELIDIDGHDLAAIGRALAAPSHRPKLIVLRTIKGHGISFMENRMEWHYLPMTEAQHAQAQKELGA
jgi:transketolase